MRRLFTLTSAAFVLLTCAVQATAASNLSVSLLKECPGTPPETLGVGAILGKIAVGAVVDWAGAMIKAQSVEKTASLGVATTEGRFHHLGSDGKMERAYSCLRVISWSHRAPAATSDGAKRALEHLNKGSDTAKLVFDPDFAADFHITGPKDMTGVFALRPVFLYFGKSHLSGWTNKERSLAVTVTFADPTAPAKAFASALFKFEQVPIGTFIDKASNPLIYDQSSGWMAAPPFTTAEAAAVANAESYVAIEQANTNAAADGILLAEELAAVPEQIAPVVLQTLTSYCKAMGDGEGQKAEQGDKQYCPLAGFKSALKIAELKAKFNRANSAFITHPLPLATLQPRAIGFMSVTVGVTETRAPSALWAAVSSAYDAQKEELGGALRKKLIPSVRHEADKLDAEADIKDANARDESKGLFEDAKLKVVEAQETVDALTDTSTKLEVATAKTALIKAKLKANSAARSSGQALPHPELDA